VAHPANFGGAEDELPSADGSKGEKTPPKDAHQEVRAHREKLFPRGLDGIDQDIVDLVLRLDTERPEESDIQIARKFYAIYDDAEQRAKRALSRIRRLRLDGKTSLPART
jgi:hypothetical protein